LSIAVSAVNPVTHLIYEKVEKIAYIKVHCLPFDDNLRGALGWARTIDGYAVSVKENLSEAARRKILEQGDKDRIARVTAGYRSLKRVGKFVTNVIHEKISKCH
jgi:hypothetical protein